MAMTKMLKGTALSAVAAMLALTGTTAQAQVLAEVAVDAGQDRGERSYQRGERQRGEGRAQ